MTTNRMPRRLIAAVGATLGLVVVAALAVAGPARAQDEAEAHPAHIHSGTCAELGDVVAPLSDVALPAGGDAMGPASALPAKVSETTVDIPLQTIIDGGHAINVHERAEAIDVYIACGDIGGPVVDDTLVIGLGEQNNSGHTGVAVLRADGDATDVAVYLTEPAEGTGAMEASPAAAAAADAAAAGDAATGEEVAAEIEFLTYDPDPIEIAVGDTVAWTNRDALVHTVSARDGESFGSATLGLGDEFRHTFTEPGTYDYFCAFHAQMGGTVVVR